MKLPFVCNCCIFEVDLCIIISESFSILCADNTPCCYVFSHIARQNRAGFDGYKATLDGQNIIILHLSIAIIVSSLTDDSGHLCHGALICRDTVSNVQRLANNEGDISGTTMN